MPDRKLTEFGRKYKGVTSTGPDLSFELNIESMGQSVLELWNLQKKKRDRQSDTRKDEHPTPKHWAQQDSRPNFFFKRQI